MEDTDTVSVIWIFVAFVIGFGLPLLSYFACLVMIGSSLDRKLREVINILRGLDLSVDTVSERLDRLSSDRSRKKTEKRICGDFCPSDCAAGIEKLTTNGFDVFPNNPPPATKSEVE